MSSAKNQVEFEAVLSTHQTVFSFTSGHILVCCQNIILVRKFFFCRNSGFIQCHQYIDLHIACSSCVFVRVKKKKFSRSNFTYSEKKLALVSVFSRLKIFKLISNAGLHGNIAHCIPLFFSCFSPFFLPLFLPIFYL